MNKQIAKIVILTVIAGSVAGLIVSHFRPQPVESRPPFGSLTGPDIQSPYLAINSVRHEYRGASLTLATTTPCAFQSPAATSTLVHASLAVTVASSTATTWTVAKASSAFATTTRLGTFSLSSGSLGTMIASSTQTSVSGDAKVVDDVSVFSPNTWLVWSKAGDTPAGTGLGGVCRAEFIVTGQ